jgi:hypothetical protein
VPGQRELDDGFDGVRREAKLQFVFLTEPLGPLRHEFLRDDPFFVVGVGQDALEFAMRVGDQFGRDDETTGVGGGEMKLELAQHTLADRDQRAGAGFLRGGEPGDGMQAVVGEQDINAEGAEALLILMDN